VPVTNLPGAEFPPGKSLTTEIDTVQLSLFSPGYFFLMSYPGMLAEPVAFALRTPRVQALSEMPPAVTPTSAVAASTAQKLNRDEIIKIMFFIVRRW
jgi:hypothetical protein